jgi:tetratricopeptide (TPR) repeat protein
VLFYPAVLATLDGRLDEAAAQSAQFVEIGERLGSGPFVRERAAWVGGRARVLLGGEYALAEVSAGAEGRSPTSLGWEPNALAHLGRREEAQSAALRLLEGGGSIADLGLPLRCHLLETACLIEDREMAERLATELESVASLAVEGRALACPARLLGAAAALLGQPEKARAYFERALELCAGIRFRPEIAFTRLQLAELLLAHYTDERSAALEHIDFAIAEFREMKMQPALERALRHKAVLGA